MHFETKSGFHLYLHSFLNACFRSSFGGRYPIFLRQYNIYQETLSLKTVFVGDISEECPKISNHIINIILGKQFKYKSRYQDTIPQYNVFKLEIDHTYNVEKYLAVKNDKEESFNFKWSAISNPWTSNRINLIIYINTFVQ